MAESVKFESAVVWRRPGGDAARAANAHGLDDGFYVFRCAWCGAIGNPWEVTGSSFTVPVSRRTDGTMLLFDFGRAGSTALLGTATGTGYMAEVGTDRPPGRGAPPGITANVKSPFVRAACASLGVDHGYPNRRDAR